MKNFLLIKLLLFVVFSFAQKTTVMSYNIKLDYPKEGENSWVKRKTSFFNQIKKFNPDFLNVQEAMPNQMAEIDSFLYEYSFIGVGRDDGKNGGEFSAIFYKKNKFKVIKDSTFWLSPTPNLVSKGWGANFHRVCTFGFFEAIKSGEKFWVFNTHFDHESELARKESAKLILQKIKEKNVENLPVILTGDLNMTSEAEGIQLISQELKDACLSYKKGKKCSGTFNGFSHDLEQKRIDFIFISDDFKIKKIKTIKEYYGENMFISDHFPVMVWLRF